LNKPLKIPYLWRTYLFCKRGKVNQLAYKR